MISIIPGPPPNYKTLIDEASTTVTYIGEANPGTATSAAEWRVKRLTEVSNDVQVEWADGNDSFDNIWDNRAALSYS